MEAAVAVTLSRQGHCFSAGRPMMAVETQEAISCRRKDSRRVRRKKPQVIGEVSERPQSTLIANKSVRADARQYVFRPGVCNPNPRNDHCHVVGYCLDRKVGRYPTRARGEEIRIMEEMN